MFYAANKTFRLDMAVVFMKYDRGSTLKASKSENCDLLKSPRETLVAYGKITTPTSSALIYFSSLVIYRHKQRVIDFSTLRMCS